MDTNKIILEANTIPRVDLGFMNNTHFEEIEMVKELGEYITAYQQNDSKDEAEKITKSLNIWLEHTEAHFARENKLMQETHFPAYPVHSQEHEIAFNQMETITKAWQMDKNIDPVAEYVFTYWPDWFNAHVNSMDMMTAKFALMNGYSE
jgi:hemerythrin